MKLPNFDAPINPRRGEIWRADLEPTVGAEIQKNNRPVLVLSVPKVGARTIRICAPITDYSPVRDKTATGAWRLAIAAKAVYPKHPAPM